VSDTLFMECALPGPDEANEAPGPENDMGEDEALAGVIVTLFMECMPGDEDLPLAGDMVTLFIE
jgi:hypothetical protein